MTDPRLRLAEEALQRFPRQVTAHGPEWVVDRSRPGVWAMSTPYPVSFLNGAALARPDEIDDVDALVAEVVEDFVSRGLPWAWSTTPGSTSPALESALRHAGLTESSEPIMHLALPAALPGPGRHHVVVDSRASREVMAAMVAGFGGPEEMVQVLLSLQDHLSTGHDVTAFVVEDDRVLGAAQGFSEGGRVVVSNVAVREEDRGRGIGAAVTAAVLATAQDRAVTDAVLVSSPLGHSVYAALGFVDVGTRTTWSWTGWDDWAGA